MRIIHCCLCGPYTDGLGYQENYLAKYNRLHGHEVFVIASQALIVNGKMESTAPGRYESVDGYVYYRLPAPKVLPSVVQARIRRFPALNGLIIELRPDVILFHGACSFELMTVARYKRKNPEVRLYVDSHAAFYNSARGFLSKQILHRVIYRHYFERSRKQIDKVLYVAEASRIYLRDVFQLDEDSMELFPLGGVIISEQDKRHMRALVYERYHLGDETMLFVHSGKLDALKRTDALLRAFSKVKDERMRLFIIGSIPKDQEPLILDLIHSDNRVSYLGWMDRHNLIQHIAAASMYLQPGSVSATLQNAICAGTPVMVYPHKDYEPYVKENGYLISDEQSMVAMFDDVSKEPCNLNVMSEMAYQYGRAVLDYDKLARRLYI